MGDILMDKSSLENLVNDINTEEMLKENGIRTEADYTDRNMKEKIEPFMFLIDNAKLAFDSCGIPPKVVPIRGGTDGAELSYRGLPCPNLSTGGHNFHSEMEFIPVQSMEKMVDVLLEIAKMTACN